MKILIIGASGLLAGPVIRKMDDAGHQLRLFSRSIKPSMFINDYDIIKGDLFEQEDLEKAMEGCDAVHISISTPDEKKATECIVQMAQKKDLKLISMVSGCTVAEENRWFKFIDNKFQAEQIIIQSGIPYVIFRPTWFFESLDLMIRNGKATILGKQANMYHWIATDDFARMVVEAYLKPEAKNKIFYVFGPEQYQMKELLERYCKAHHPEIGEVKSAPLGMIKIIAAITRNKELKTAAELFAYFEKTPESGSSREADLILGEPEITFDKWLAMKE